MKRIFDVLFSTLALLILFIPILVISFLIWLQDFKTPFYFAPRVGKNFKMFKMIKLRSMIINADATGVESTKSDDPRITSIGMKVRKYKVDEFTQLWNVLMGHMSLVGPRPNTEKGVSTYTELEKKLLEIKPGMTDFSSIIFSDEGEILKDSTNPDLNYDSLIRPWKSRLGILYCEKHNISLDLKIIFFTIISIFSKKIACKYIANTLEKLKANEDLIDVSKRKKPLKHTINI